MAKAWSRSQQRVIDVPDEQLQQLQTGLQQVQTAPSQQLDSLVGGADTLTGKTIKQHSIALQKAQQAKDTASIKVIKDNLDREFKYQQTFVQPAQYKAAAKAETLRKEAKKEAPDPATLSVIDVMEKQFFGEGGDKTLAFGRAGPGGRAFGGLKRLQSKLLPGSEDAERIRLYDATVQSSLARLAKAGGDAANIAVMEQLMQQKKLPTFGDTPKEAVKKMQAAREALRLGESKVLTTAAGKTGAIKKERGEAGLGVFDPLLGASKLTIQDIVTGATAEKTQEAANASIKAAEKLMEQAKTTTNLEQKLDLINQAQEIFSQVGGQQSEIASKFSRDVDANAILRGLALGSQVASAGQLGAGAIGKAQALRGAGTKGLTGGFRPAVRGKALRTEVIEEATKAGKKVDGNTILKNLISKSKEARANLSATQQRKLTKDFIAGAKNTFKDKKLTPKQAKRIWDQANKGFTKAGDAGKTVESEYNRLLREAIRGPLDKAAPGFEQGTALIAKGLGRKRTIGKAARVGSTIGAVATPLLILQSLMRNRNRNEFSAPNF
jgi:hypothetical protein